MPIQRFQRNPNVNKPNSLQPPEMFYLAPFCRSTLAPHIYTNVHGPSRNLEFSSRSLIEIDNNPVCFRAILDLAITYQMCY